MKRKYLICKFLSTTLTCLYMYTRCRVLLNEWKSNASVHTKGPLRCFVPSMMTAKKSGISEYYGLSTEMSIPKSPTLEYCGGGHKQPTVADLKGILRSVWYRLCFLHASDIDWYVRHSRPGIKRYRHRNIQQAILKKTRSAYHRLWNVRSRFNSRFEKSFCLAAVGGKRSLCKG